jgi:hypothetical protein
MIEKNYNITFISLGSRYTANFNKYWIGILCTLAF